MDVCVLDPRDPAVVRRHWEIGHAAELAARPYDLFWSWESARVTHAEGRSDTESVLLGAYDGALMVGAGQLNLPVHDNRHVAFAEFFVHPDHQRRGVGRQLVGAGEQAARNEGRRLLMVEVYAPPEADSAGLAFARALGYAEALEEGMKALDLPATEHRWAALEREVAGHRDGYPVRTWSDRVPTELVDGFCRLMEAFNTEAPLGDLELEAERWDERRVRDREARDARSGRHTVGTAALAPDGQVVGLTEVVLDDSAAWRGMQSGTLVLPGHRGHRLGLGMKLANQRAIRARHPSCALLVTGNAGVNAPMNAVNEALGYRLLERCLEVQKALG